jgi:hypothetical protein
MGKRRVLSRILVGKSQGKRRPERFRRRREDNIKINFQDVETWIGSMWLRIETGDGLV